MSLIGAYKIVWRLGTRRLGNPAIEIAVIVYYYPAIEITVIVYYYPAIEITAMQTKSSSDDSEPGKSPRRWTLFM